MGTISVNQFKNIHYQCLVEACGGSEKVANELIAKLSSAKRKPKKAKQSASAK